MNDLWGNKIGVGDFIRFPTPIISNVCQIKYAKVLGIIPGEYNRPSLKIRSASVKLWTETRDWKLATRSAVLEHCGHIEKVKELPLELFELFESFREVECGI